MNHESIAVFDIESTGTDIVNDRIIQICIRTLRWPELDRPRTTFEFINPTIPIPQSATDIHKITDDDVRDKPVFADIAKELFTVFEQSQYIAGFNSNRFDVQILAEEFERVGMVFPMSHHKFIDAQIIFHKKEPRTLAAAFELYSGQKTEQGKLHDSDYDVYMTCEVLRGMMQRHAEFKEKPEAMITYTHTNADLAGKLFRDSEGNLCFAFGQYKGEKVSEHLDYADWMINKDFPILTKRMLIEEIHKDAVSEPSSDFPF